MWQAVEIDRIVAPSGTWGEYGRITMIAGIAATRRRLKICAAEL